MTFPLPYIDYLLYFHGNRDYFECHEVLEEHWKKTGMGRDSIWVGFIQIAVSLYHYRRGNMRGALKLARKSLLHISDKEKAVSKLGLDHKKLMSTLQENLQRIESNLPYRPFDLPISDPSLNALCRELAERQNVKWGKKNESSDPLIVDKHLTRDRSGVLAERELSKMLKRSANIKLCTAKLG